MKEILDVLTSGGPYGVIALLLWAIRMLDARLAQAAQVHHLALQQAQTNLQAEHDRRLEDQKQATKALLDLNDRVHLALDRTAEMVEAIQRTGTRIPP